MNSFGQESPLSVLVIDDDRDVPWQIEVLLKQSEFKWRFDSVSGGDYHIYEKIENAEFDILILDHRMGSINGIDVIRKVSKLQSKAVVILTNHDDPELMHGYLENGAIGFMVKGELNSGYLERSLIYAYKNWVNKKLLAEINESIASSERLSTTSAMAQGIAHQYNNGLAIISGNLELLERKIGENPDISRLLNPIIETVARLGHLTKRMSTILMDRSLALQSTNVALLLSEYVNSLIAQHPHINFTLNCPSEPVHCLVERGKLTLVFDEIVQNAIESMWSKDEKCINTHMTYDIDSASIQIQDYGIGLQVDPIQAMRPFVTTKGAFSSGRDDMQTKTSYGLGLTLAQSFLYDMGGSVQLASHSSNGSTVTIKLPIYHNG